MGTVALSAFYPYIEPDVMGCPQPGMDIAIKDALMELCEETRWWSDDLTPNALVSGTPSYTLAAPAEAEIVRPQSIKIDDRDLGPSISREELDVRYPGWEAAVGVGPRHWFMISPTEIRLFPIPTDESVTLGYEINCRAAIKPSRTTLIIQDRFLSDVRQAVRAGALSRLLKQRAIWRDLDRAKDEKREFEDEIAKLRWRMEMGGGERVGLADTGGMVGTTTQRNSGAFGTGFGGYFGVCI